MLQNRPVKVSIAAAATCVIFLPFAVESHKSYWSGCIKVRWCFGSKVFFASALMIFLVQYFLKSVPIFSLWRWDPVWRASETKGVKSKTIEENRWVADSWTEVRKKLWNTKMVDYNCLEIGQTQVERVTRNQRRGRVYFKKNCTWDELNRAEKNSEELNWGEGSGEELKRGGGRQESLRRLDKKWKSWERTHRTELKKWGFRAVPIGKICFSLLYWNTPY